MLKCLVFAMAVLGFAQLIQVCGATDRSSTGNSSSEATPLDATAKQEATKLQETDAPSDQLRRSDLNRQWVESVGLVRIPVLEEYLNALLRRVQAAGPQPPRYARVFIRADPGLMAATTSIGHIYVSLGWIETIESEDEMVALLAHEYGHRVLGHHASNWVGEGGYFAQIAYVVAAAATKHSVSLAPGIGVAVWGQVFEPAWSRSQESEADAFALDTTMTLGYSYARGPKAFLERIAAREPATDARKGPSATTKPANAMAALGESHPDPQQRLDSIAALVTQKYTPRARVEARAKSWRAVIGQATVAEMCTAYRRAAKVSELLAKADKRHALDEALAASAASGKSQPFIQTQVAYAYLAVGNDDTALATLTDEMKLPEPGWRPYLMAASIHQMRGRQDAATEVLERGFARYDKPFPLYPFMIDYYRTLRDRSPPNSPPYSAANLKMVPLVLTCITSAEFSAGCADAAMTAAEKAKKKAAEEQQAQQKTKQVTDKLDSKLKKLFNLGR